MIPSSGVRRALRLLDSKNPVDLLQFVAENPGVTPHRARLATGLTKRSFQQTLQDLSDNHRLIVILDAGRHYLFIPQPGLEGGGWKQVMALHNPNVRLLFTYLLNQGPCLRPELVQHAVDQWDWPVSSTEHRLKMLAEAGLVAVETGLASDMRRCSQLRPLEPNEAAMYLLRPAGLMG